MKALPRVVRTCFLHEIDQVKNIRRRRGLEESRPEVNYPVPNHLSLVIIIVIVHLSCMGQANLINCGTFLAIILVVHEYQDWPSLTEEIQENPKRKKKLRPCWNQLLRITQLLLSRVLFLLHL